MQTEDAKIQQVIYLAPTGSSVGLTSVSMGMVRALDRMGIHVAFFKPIAQLFRGDTGPERSTYVIRHTTELNPPDPIAYSEAENLLSSGEGEQLLEQVVERFHEAADGADVVVVEGMINMDETERAAELNHMIARALDASVILVGSPIHDNLARLDADLNTTAKEFGGIESDRTLGAIANFVNAPRDANGQLRPELELENQTSQLDAASIRSECKVFQNPNFKLLGTIPWNQSMAVSRTYDVARHLGAEILNEGDVRSRRVHNIYLCARHVDNITHVFEANALLIIPVDRMDLFIAACMAAINGVPLAGIVLTSALEPIDERVLSLCEKAMETGLPILTVPTNSYSTATMIPRMNTEVPVDDRERIEMGMNFVASKLSKKWIRALAESRHEPRLSPAAFRYRLVQYARNANKRIVLPEGDEPRTIEAAVTCQQRGIARCVLLGDPSAIHACAEKIGVEIPDTLEIIDPANVRDQYIDPFVDLRKHKGIDRQMAALQLEDNVALGTMMLKQGDVDGLVSGAVHTTAATVRPALQLIKTRPGNRFVSSIFFMLLPDQVVLYGDCAILEDPDAETLASVAIQGAESAKAFGIPPRVAMISYSTGDSGQGSDVEKVKEATRIAKELRPDLLIDGPLQYDAASTASVAKSKAPDSPVAGQATVYIFPDLNTGNTTYKAVQRSANVVSIGPMLQGLNAPVNDLSRGALVEDIVYTIALTAIQANQESR